MCEYMPTKRTRVRLYSEFGSYDKQVIQSYIDEAPICHVSAIVEGAPYIQATVHWRNGEQIYVHGAVKNKLVSALRKGAEACLSFSHFDGYILPRSGFNHAVLYRSVIAYSTGRFVEDLEEKNLLLERFIERIQPGRWQTIRQPSTEELKQTGIIEFSLNEVSAKSIGEDVVPYIMPGGEMEAPEDDDYSPWTGVIPYSTVAQDPVSAQDI